MIVSHTFNVTINIKQCISEQRMIVCKQQWSVRNKNIKSYHYFHFVNTAQHLHAPYNTILSFRYNGIIWLNSCIIRMTTFLLRQTGSQPITFEVSYRISYGFFAEFYQLLSYLAESLLQIVVVDALLPV